MNEIKENNSIYFINIPVGTDYSVKQARNTYPSFGIMLLASILKQHKYNVAILDIQHLDVDTSKALQFIKERRPIFVGISVMTLQIPEALFICKAIKAKYPEVTIIWGGSHVSLFPKETLSDACVDIVVINEATQTIVSLASKLKYNQSLNSLDGIGFKQNGSIIINLPKELDDIKQCPHFDFSILDNISDYCINNRFAAYLVDNPQSVRTFPILSALGCCYTCTFCINRALKRRYRFRDAEDLIEEVIRLQRDYAADCIIFQDEDFFISKERLFRFLDLIEKRKLKFRWRTWIRADYFNKEYITPALVKRLEQCGLREVAIGAESGSQRIIDYLKKNITIEDIEQSAKYMKGSKIAPRYSFIYGFPDESKKEMMQTFKLAAKLMRINNRTTIAGPYFLRLYPGTPLFNQIKSQYNLPYPQTIDDWRDAFSSEGFLHPSKYPWLIKKSMLIQK